MTFITIKGMTFITIKGKGFLSIGVSDTPIGNQISNQIGNQISRIMNNRVNHPEYYKKKNGIETIEVIRHYVCDIANAQKYLMRAGEKPEQGMTAEEKEVEDLRKALWYIHDVRKHRLSILFTAEAVKIPTMLLKIFDTTGHEVANITKGFNEHISKALRRLLLVGLISDGKIYCCRTPTVCLSEATQEIQQRILEIEELRIKNEE